MAFELLRTDYVDAVFEGLRRYMLGDNGDGTVSFIDVTNYTVREGAFFGAKDANTINTAVNAILAALNNGTNLYDVFTIFFETQKTLFEEESDAKQEGFEQYITELRTYMDGKWDELKDEYTGDIQYFKDVQENAFNVWFQMVRDQLTNDVAGHLQTQIGNLTELQTDNNSNLVDAVNEVRGSAVENTADISKAVKELNTVKTNAAANSSAIGKLSDLRTSAKGNLVAAVNEVKDSSGVTGVKGNKEGTYRKGNVNLTPANIGALPDATVPVNKGGTGQTTAANAANFFINSLSVGSDAPKDNDYFISQYVNGGTATTTFHRRPIARLWDYMKSKIEGMKLTAVYDETGDKIVGKYLVVNKGIILCEKGEFTNDTIKLALGFQHSYLLITREITVSTYKVYGYRAKMYATPKINLKEIDVLGGENAGTVMPPVPSAANLCASANAGVTFGTFNKKAANDSMGDSAYGITLKATSTYIVSYALYSIEGGETAYVPYWSNVDPENNSFRVSSIIYY